jgi:hypothetical protein
MAHSPRGLLVGLANDRGRLLTDPDFPPEASTQKNEIGKRQFEELTGLNWSAPVSQHIRACRFHISPHDLSLMRELFGVPQYVISAVPNARGNFIACLFQ